MGAWDDWELEVDALHDAGDKVVALVRQHGRSKTAGTAVEMSFAQIWTLRDGKQTRMDMYSDRDGPSKPPGCGTRAAIPFPALPTCAGSTVCRTYVRATGNRGGRLGSPLSLK